MLYPDHHNDVSACLHYGSNALISPLLCLADAGWIITTQEEMGRRRSYSLGEHGCDNAAALMRALFIAYGPAFRQGIVLPEFPMTPTGKIRRPELVKRVTGSQ